MPPVIAEPLSRGGRYGRDEREKKMETIDRTQAIEQHNQLGFENSVVGIVRTHDDAEEVVKDLQRAGFDMKKLSVIGKGYHSEEHPLGFYTTGDRIKGWGGLGVFWGSIWGLLLGAAFFWIPGLGPLAVAGPFTHLLITGLEGAVLGGGVGALGGALTGLGLSKESVIKYETRVKADNYLVIAHGTPEEVERAQRILQSRVLEAPETVTMPSEQPKARHAGFAL
jgi:hypothetical protein